MLFKSVGNNLLIIAIYVDDGLAASNDSEILREVIEHLKSKFEITTMDAKCFVGIQIRRDLEGVIIHQTAYAQKLVKRFEPYDSKMLATPMKQGIKYISTGTADGAISRSVQVPYREALGGLMYLAAGTRPDLSCAVAILSRFCNNPKLAHWTALKDVLKYVNSTISLGIRYHRQCQDELIAFSDSDYASDIESRKSMTGMLIKLNDGPIVWKATKQTTVTESTAEAEFVACSTTSREVIWCQSFLRELGVEISLPTPLFVDNQSAIRLVKNNQIHSKIKQLDIRLMAVREREASKQIEIRYVDTEEQQADVFTKALARPRFVKLRQLIGMTFVCLLLFVPLALCMRLDLRATTRGPVRNKIKLQIKEPCALIEETELEFLGKAQLSEEYKANRGMVSATHMLCKRIFDQQVKAAIKELNGCLPHDRNKRWIAAALGAAKTAAKVGDVVLGITDTISSIHNAMVGTDNRTYEEMTSRLNQTSREALSDKQSKIKEARQELAIVSDASIYHPAQITEESDDFPLLLWSSNHAVSELYAGVANLKALKNHRGLGQLATKEIGEMLDDHELMRLEPEETTLESIIVDLAKQEIMFVYLLDEAIELTLEQVLKYVGTGILFACIFSTLLVNLRLTRRMQYAEHKFDGIRSERRLEIEF